MWRIKKIVDIFEKKLSGRLHVCTCGLTIKRDLNASFNVLKLGLFSLGIQSLEAHTIS